MTQTLARRFRFGAFSLCWLGAAALQVYTSDVGTHGVIVGAYLPDWLLAIASIPPWTLLAPAVFDGIVAALAQRVPSGLVRALTIVNAVALVSYAFASIGVIFYIAFANNGVS